MYNGENAVVVGRKNWGRPVLPIEEAGLTGALVGAAVGLPVAGTRVPGVVQTGSAAAVAGAARTWPGVLRQGVVAVGATCHQRQSTNPVLAIRPRP